MLEECGLLAHPHTSAGRVPTDAGIATTSISCCRPRPPPSSALARPARGRRGDADDERDAVTGHEPAGDRHRAADRDDDDPPHRGSAAAAAGADGGRDHVHGRRLQEGLHVRPSGRLGLDGLGERVPQRSPRRHGSGRADAPHQARRPVAAARRARVRRRARARLHRAGRDRRGHAVRGRVAPAGLGVPLPGRLAAQRADGDARAAGVDARRAVVGAGLARDVRADRRREHRAGAAVAVAGGGELRLAAAQSGHRVGDRADADGLCAGDPVRARGGPRAVALRRELY